MFANVQNLKMVFVMSSRTVPVAAARLCHSGSRSPVPVDAACCRPLCGSLLVLVGGVVACRCSLLWVDYRTQGEWSAEYKIKKVCISVCARVFC